MNINWNVCFWKMGTANKFCNNEKQGGGQEYWKKVIVDQCEKLSGSLIFRILDYYWHIFPWWLRTTSSSAALLYFFNSDAEDTSWRGLLPVLQLQQTCSTGSEVPGLRSGHSLHVGFWRSGLVHPPKPCGGTNAKKSSKETHPCEEPERCKVCCVTEE